MISYSTFVIGNKQIATFCYFVCHSSKLIQQHTQPISNAHRGHCKCIYHWTHLYYIHKNKIWQTTKSHFIVLHSFHTSFVIGWQLFPRYLRTRVFIFLQKDGTKIYKPDSTIYNRLLMETSSLCTKMSSNHLGLLWQDWQEKHLNKLLYTLLFMICKFIFTAIKLIVTGGGLWGRVAGGGG